MSDEKRLAYCRVTGEVLVDMFKEGNAITVFVEHGLPEDSEFRRLEYDPRTDAYMLIVWSSEFEPLHEAEEIPEVTPSPTFGELEGLLDAEGRESLLTVALEQVKEEYPKFVGE